jgi:gluconate kinase
MGARFRAPARSALVQVATDVGDCVWIVTGVPGAGKTTTGRRLAERLEKSAFIEGDAICTLIVGGHVRPEDEPPDEAERQLDLSVTNQAMLAKSLYDAGFTPVIDWIVSSGDRLWQYREILEGRPIRFVVLAPGEQVSLSRHHARGKYVAEQWLHLHESFERVRGLGLWIDNSDDTVDDVVDVVLRRTGEALLDFARVPRSG